MPRARSARLLESADLGFSIGYEAKPIDKDRKAKVSKALGLATDLTNTSVRSASSVLPKARWKVGDHRKTEIVIVCLIPYFV